MNRMLCSVVAAALAAPCFAASVRVGTVAELKAAVAAVMKDASAPKEIVLRPGTYVLTEAIRFEGPAANGLVLRAEKPGTAVLTGGVPLTGWTRDAATGLWTADVPKNAPSGGRFRILIKNDEWVDLAVYPGGTNRFDNGGKFDAFLLPNLAGHWSRKSTDEENRVMPYDAKDLPDAMDLENADVHLFHMWDVSLCTVEKVDRAKHVLTTVETPSWPMGACNRRQYEILNVREGLKPGGWYLERKRGKVCYMALPGEDPNRQSFVLPVLDQLVVGTKAKDVAVEGLVFTATVTDFAKRAGFGGCGLPGALALKGIDGLRLRHVTVKNVGGVGIDVGGGRRLDMRECEVKFTGALSLAMTPSNGAKVERCLFSDAGKIYQASTGVWLSGNDVSFCNNEIRRTPYSGVIGFGARNRFETNFVHHVMQVLHDGAAFYGLHVDCVIRGNVVRDVRAIGQGFGVHAYYSDEGSRNTVMEDNYAEEMPIPIHNHMTVGQKVRGNVLVNRTGDMVVSFERSRDGEFSGNTIICDGELKVVWPDAVSAWSNNFALAASPAGALSLPGTWNLERPLLESRGPLATPRAKAKPTVDGTFADGEWHGDFCHLERSPERRMSGFADALARFMWDDEFLYASVIAANFADGKVSWGSTWGKDDGIELDLGKGRVVRGFNNGATQVEGLKGVKVVALGKGKTGNGNPNYARYEIAVPWSALGIRPAVGLEVPFGVTAYVSDARQYKCYDAPSLKPVLKLGE